MAGYLITFLWAMVIRGNKTPLSVLCTSSNVEEFGDEVPMPAEPDLGKVFWALMVRFIHKNAPSSVKIGFMRVVFE